MGKKKFLLILVIAVMMTTVITGCTTPATEPTEEATTGDSLSFYFLLKTLSNPHWVAMKEGIEAAAAEAGVEVYVDAMNSEDELSGQLDKLLTAAGQGYDGIGIAPISPPTPLKVSWLQMLLVFPLSTLMKKLMLMNSLQLAVIWLVSRLPIMSLWVVQVQPTSSKTPNPVR